MGIDYTTYIGPHVRCKTTKVPSLKNVRACSNDKCNSYAREVYCNKRFCEDCGGAITQVSIPIDVDNVIAHDVRMNLLSEALYDVPGDTFHFWMRDNNVHIWLANCHVPDSRKFSFDPKENIQYVPMNAELIAEEIKKFSAFYEKEIAILRQEYGDENVEVLWGLVHYIS